MYCTDDTKEITFEQVFAELLVLIASGRSEWSDEAENGKSRQILCCYLNTLGSKFDLDVK